MVLTFAMSFAVTSIMIWWDLRPLIAANMLRIIGASFPFVEAASPSMGSGRCGYAGRASGDDRRVDVREHVLAHVLLVHRRDDGLVADGHHERGAVHEDDRVAGALARGTGSARLETLERPVREVDAPALDPLQRVLRELKPAGARLLLPEDLVERRPVERLHAGLAGGLARGRSHGREARRHQRRVVSGVGHWTPDT